MLDLTMTSVLPLLISSVTAATMSYIFTGTEAMFKFSQTEAFEIERIPYCSCWVFFADWYPFILPV